MKNKHKPLGVNDPLRHADHSRPSTRRDFIKQGFISGPAAVLTGGVFGLFNNPREAYAAVAADLDQLAKDIPNSACKVGDAAAGSAKIPFICFDLAGGANFAGSNVLVGTDGQLNELTTAGYSKMGLPGDIIPGLSDINAAPMLNLSTNSDFTNNQLGLKFHSDSALLFGILERFTSVASGLVDGAVIPARSGNDTSNNTHNPLYGIAKAGAVGSAVTLIGSRNSESGGNSMAPPGLINPEIRPTKVDRPSDVTGMIDVGDLTNILNTKEDVVAVMESMARISHKKLNATITQNDVVRDLVKCGYIKAADIAERFADQVVDPAADPHIVDDVNNTEIRGIFSPEEFNNNNRDGGEFRKTAAVMKMVIEGYSGAGSITMGGYDYHTGDRQAGENRDLRAGRCIGACLEYAAKKNSQLMIYVFSDGSVASNGTADNTGNQTDGNGNITSLGGRGKGVWTGDNSSTACSFFLVFDPNGTIDIFDGNTMTDHRQIGKFSPSGSVVTSDTPAANNVNLLVNTVIANYMSLNGNLDPSADQPDFASSFTNHGLGDFRKYVSFNPIR